MTMMSGTLTIKELQTERLLQTQPKCNRRPSNLYSGSFVVTTDLWYLNLILSSHILVNGGYDARICHSDEK